jgi:hypothetical protein
MARVIQLPIIDLIAKIKSSDPTSGYALIDLYKTTIDGNISRRPILEHFWPRRREIQFAVRWVSEFWPWCNQHLFHLKPSASSSMEKQTINVSLEEGDIPPVELTDIQKAAFAAGLEDGASHRQLAEQYDEIARSHEYGFFPPGWEVSSAEWFAFFGEVDPCICISKYLQELFSEDSTASPRDSSIFLDNVDKSIIGLILDGFAKSLHYCDKISESIDRKTIRHLLNASCCAWLWSNKFEYFSGQYFEHANKMPEEIFIALIERWCQEYPGHAYQHKRVSEDILVDQTCFVTGYLAKHLFLRGVDKNTINIIDDILTEEQYERIAITSSITTNQILTIKQAIQESSQESEHYYIDEIASEYIYNARDTIFGGQFPFSISRSYSYLSSINSDAHFWIACMTTYTSHLYGIQIDPYTIFKYEGKHVFNHRDGGADTHRSLTRMKAFCLAFQDMKKGRMHELAEAWWAFFIASQAYAFPNLGLSPKNVGAVLDIAKSLLPSKTVDRALQYALQKTTELDPSITGRIIQYEINKILEQRSKVENNLVNLATLARDEVSFLQGRLGTKVWDGIHENSRQDLLHAEKLWTISHSKIGAGQQDWGVLILTYSRVLESEMRRHLGPLLDIFESNGIPIPKERPLGAYMAAVRTAEKEIKKGRLSGLSTIQKERTNFLVRLFEEKDFLPEQRNRAAHGNREKSLQAIDFILWRTTILDQNILKDIIN